MSNRPLLEKLSWIAAIVGCLYVVVPDMQRLFKGGTSEVNSSSELAVPLPSRAASIAEAVEVAKQAVTTKTRWECNGGIKSLYVAFNSAKEMHYRTSRDEALILVGKSALCVQDYDLLKEIIEEISYKTNRDALLKDAVDVAIGVGNLQEANGFADLMVFRSNANVAKQKIAHVALGKN